MEVERILSELESLTYLFRELSTVDEAGFQIPMKCFKKVVNDKLKSIKEQTKEL